MTTRFVFIKTLFIAAIILFSQSVLAIMIGLSTEQLTKASQTIIIGQVMDVKSQWNETGDEIITRADVAVKEIIRGGFNHERHLIVEYEGGEIGDIGLRVSDSPTLIKGENVVLFLKLLKETKNGLLCKIVGRAQGKYSIDQDGIARKTGFNVLKGKEAIENDIPVNELVSRIRAVK